MENIIEEYLITWEDILLEKKKKERGKKYRLHNCKHGKTPKRDMEGYVYQIAFNNDYLSKG